jgi:hypothetical protein
MYLTQILQTKICGLIKVAKAKNKPKTEGSFTFKAGDIRITATYSSERLIEKASADALVFARSVLAKFLFLPWAVQI